MEYKKNVFWIASYPKSGNTWLRNIMANLLFHAASFSETLYYISDFYGIQTQETLLSLPEIEFHGIKTSFIKTHAQFTHIPRRYHEIELNTVGFIYIYRHPLDVLLSAINYWQLERCPADFFENGVVQTPEQLVQQGKIDQYLSKFSENLIIEIWSSMAGSWDQNVFSWQAATPHYAYSAILKYENLLANPLLEIQKIRHISPFINRENIQNALDYAQQIRCYDPVVDSPELELFKKIFFWKGKTGNFRDYFSEVNIKQFRQKYQPLLYRLGYDQ